MPSQIALQLYTVRDYTKTPDDLARTLARAKKIGYDAVQVSAIGPIEPQRLADLLKNEGLTCCATHTPLDKIKADPKAVIAEHKLWGCEYVAIGGAGWKDATTATWTAFIDEYNGLARQFAASGVSLGYHNHSHELVKYDGTTVLQRMLDGFDPSIWFEIDVYWIAQGGGDPAAWVEKVGGRIPCVHLKDMGAQPNAVQQMREVGEGNLNWPRILDACRAAGVKWYIIEQDNCNGADPFECAERSLKNVKAMGLA